MKRFGIWLLLAVFLLVGAASAAEAPLKEGEVTGQIVDRQVLPMAEPHGEAELRTTAEGVDFIKAHEGYVSTPYDDYTQQTIGYGCNVTYAERYGFSPSYLTKSEAHDLLICVLWEFEQKLDSFLETYDIEVTDEQYDALISFTFNSPSWLNPTYRVSRLLRSGVYTPNEFASAMGIWCHADGKILKGLVSRRMDEITLFLYGLYETDSPLFCTVEYRGEGEIDNDIEFLLKGEPYGSFSAVKPPEEGYAFDGWYTMDGTRLRETDLVKRNLVVYSGWREIHGYEILSLQAEDSKGNVLEGIPDKGFYLSAEIYKAQDGGKSVALLVTYSQRGQMLDTYFLRADVPQGTTYSLGVWIDNRDGQVYECRAFVLESLAGAVPLCEAAVLEK